MNSKNKIRKTGEAILKPTREGEPTGKVATFKKKTKKKPGKKKTTKKKTQKKKVVKKKAKKKSKAETENKPKSKGGRNYKPKGVGNGGKRKGSGRKESEVTRRTREVANKIAADDEITPLEYMMSVLRETPEKLKAKYDAGELSSEEFIVELQAMQKRKDNAAEKAAPYIHPRLSAIEAKVKGSGHEEWLAMMADLEANK